jgi:Arc/MetJ-type ribon-helix-helix transcriptional regulator
MKTLEIEVPDEVAEALTALVKKGWFASEAEAARLALADFVRHHRLELQEQFQRDDIAWALSLRKVAE